MILHFGHNFDGIVYAPPVQPRTAEFYAGPGKLLFWLEAQFGLSGYRNNTAYLRIELYRQSLHQYLTEIGLFHRPFFEASFSADRFATAEALIGRRDDLLMAGWNFEEKPDMPERLRDLARVENIFQKKLVDPELSIQAFGVTDRYEQVLGLLAERPLPLESVVLYEPETLQLPVIQRLLAAFRQLGVSITTAEIPNGAVASSMLGRWQKGQGNGVGALAVLRARRDSDAACFIAQTLSENPDYRPCFLLPEMNLILEQNLIQEGFAPMGVLSASLARPSLQVLKLAPAFLWEPVDVFKIMEFVTLPVKPLDTGLALEIARVMAEKPGLFSDSWYGAVFGYLEQAEVSDKARKQYDFWFDRRRYPADSAAPKRDAIAIYAYLQDWAYDYYEESGSSNSSLLVLAEQARRIRELLETLPEQRIGFLELERIVRTIYEPSPMQLGVAETGSLQFIHQPGAIAAPVSDLIWWNCVYENNLPPPDPWKKEEREYLAKENAHPETPRQQSRRNLFLQYRPLFRTTESLLLVIPDQVEGAESVSPLLWSDLEALFGEELKSVTYSISDESDLERFANWLKTRAKSDLPCRQSVRPKPRIRFPKPELLLQGDYETPTQLESLFYYPHRWFFRQKLRLYRSSLLSVTGDNTLLGSLAHRFFEKLLPLDFQGFTRENVHEWVEQEALQLFPREGATLLLYGREPERRAFLNKVKNAAWSLISLLRNNGWTVEKTEMELEGEFGGVPVKGKADLVLRRDQEQAIIDLKWSGVRRRKELIQNGEDLQLVLYAHLLPPPESWPHTAYFILDEGKMVARNNAAFKEAVMAGRGDADHAEACKAIFDKMLNTYKWRLDQLRNGWLELRNARTAPELEALYEGQLFDLLEMKQEDARWDDYWVFFRD